MKKSDLLYTRGDPRSAECDEAFPDEILTDPEADDWQNRTAADGLATAAEEMQELYGIIRGLRDKVTELHAENNRLRAENTAAPALLAACQNALLLLTSPSPSNFLPALVIGTLRSAIADAKAEPLTPDSDTTRAAELTAALVLSKEEEAGGNIEVTLP